MIQIPNRWLNLCISLLLLSTSSAQLSGDPKKDRGNSIYLSIYSMPESLDVFTVVDTTAQQVFRLVYDGLVDFDDQFEPVPNLASSWEVSSDRLVWTFPIREGVTFHDGTPLTAHDAVYTYRQYLLAGPDHTERGRFDFIKRVDMVDDYTFVIYLKYPYPGILHNMNHAIAATGSSDSSAANGIPNGTGPYKITEIDESRIVLEHHQSYHFGSPSIANVTFKHYQSHQSAWAALLQNDVDFVEDLSVAEYNIVREDSRFSVYEYPLPFYYTLLFNNDDPVLSDHDVRRAIDTAINREDIIQTALSGRGSAARGPFGPTADFYSDTPAPNVGGDIKAAGEILDALGWVDTDRNGIRDKNGTDLTLEIVIDRGDPFKERAARRLQWQLLQAGIGIEIVEIPTAKFLTTSLIPGKYQMALLQFNSAMDPAASLMLFWHSGAIDRSNIARYRNQRVDTLIDVARQSYSPEDRVLAYSEIQNHIQQDVPAAFLFFRNHYVAVSSRIEIIDVKMGSIYGGIRKWRIIE